MHTGKGVSNPKFTDLRESRGCMGIPIIMLQTAPGLQMPDEIFSLKRPPQPLHTTAVDTEVPVTALGGGTNRYHSG